MAIRLTETRLRQIIREEVASLNEGANTRYEALAMHKILGGGGYRSEADNRLYQAVQKAWWKVSKDAGLPLDAVGNLYKKTVLPTQGYISQGTWGAESPQEEQIAAVEDFIVAADSMLGGSIVDLTLAALSPTQSKLFSTRMGQHRPKTEEEKAAEKARRREAGLRGAGAHGSIDYSRYGG
jgi:hypothetical protein